MQTNIEVLLIIIKCGILYTIKPYFSKFSGDFGNFSGDFGDSGGFSKSSDPIVATQVYLSRECQIPVPKRL